MAVTSSGTVTSALIATASPPAAAMVATTSSACGALARWFTTTRYPCLASTNAVAAPIPRLAPVIRATRPIVLTSSQDWSRSAIVKVSWSKRILIYEHTQLLFRNRKRMQAISLGFL